MSAVPSLVAMLHGTHLRLGLELLRKRGLAAARGFYRNLTSAVEEDAEVWRVRMMLDMLPHAPKQFSFDEWDARYVGDDEACMTVAMFGLADHLLGRVAEGTATLGEAVVPLRRWALAAEPAPWAERLVPLLATTEEPYVVWQMCDILEQIDIPHDPEALTRAVLAHWSRTESLRVRVATLILALSLHQTAAFDAHFAHFVRALRVQTVWADAAWPQFVLQALALYGVREQNLPRVRDFVFPLVLERELPKVALPVLAAMLLRPWCLRTLLPQLHTVLAAQHRHALWDSIATRAAVGAWVAADGRVRQEEEEGAGEVGLLRYWAARVVAV